ncbi:ATP-dependent protease [Mycobacterium antarcticum]|uniref:LON peptidase substrate-binding domain-containing protein n=1 Tax=unclassified Mycolicibacterium TaxID=2636767 RepID=UPI002386E882|nr:MULTISPECIES: LON peptidase substrate-binding domain-containing protein [unclassified Mycolicibacterium]BDX34570.1 ATP-dependent protease [Mycolicibacterium sp. TUM20985]GLP81826.1 ATP-dependent protease [Mycolicibacterium sp. TUM20984]
MTIRPMFPLESVRLPGEDLPLRIFEPRYSALVRQCLDDAREFGVVLIAAGREVGGDDVRCDVGSMAHIVDFQDLGEGRFVLDCEMRERIRVTSWLDDDPYPQAEVEPWPDEPGPNVTGDDIGVVEDRLMELFERIASAREAMLPPRQELLGEPEPGDDAGKRLYALASRVPMGQADRYSVLEAPSAAKRLDVLRDAVETVAAMVEFQLTDEGPAD